VSGTRVAETILASVHMRARQQAGHMDASDLIKSMQRQSCKEGAVHIWDPDADRHAKLLIHLVVEGSTLSAYLHATPVFAQAAIQGRGFIRVFLSEQ
jgi:hypothetical protein